MIERRTKPQVDPTAVAPAFSDLPAEFDRAMPWARDAACRDEPVELFFPPKMVRGPGAIRARRERLEDAKAVCARCPVRQECLEHALELPEEFGIWGGLTQEERRAMGESRRRARSKSA